MTRFIVSMPYGMAFRNVVCCGVLDGVLRRGADVTMLLPQLAPTDDVRVRGEIPEGVRVAPLLPAHSDVATSALKALKQYYYARRTGLDSFRIKYQRRRRQQPLFHVMASVAEQLGSRLVSERTVDALLRRAQPNEGHYKRLLTELGADRVVVMKPGYQPEDLPLLKAAMTLGLPTISIDTTWDNMVSKRPAYIRPDAVTLWNRQMAEEARTYYDFRSTAAIVTGGSQFDAFFDRDHLPEREDFLRGCGLDPTRKVLVLTLGHPMYTPDNKHHIKILLDAIDEGLLHGGPNLVVRVHPWDRFTDYDDAASGHSRVRIERPFGLPQPGSVFECLPSKTDVRHYGALMCYADVVLNSASTTSLDAIAADKPVANIAFDVTATHPENSMARLYNFTHYKPIVDSRAVRVCSSVQELIATVNAYLSDPSMDASERAAARTRFLTYSDGRSSERVAEAIVSFS